MKYFFAAAVIGLVPSLSSAAVYDFQEYIDGKSVEEGYSTFTTSPTFDGPTVDITATKDDQTAFVYFDKGDAGIGVCGVLLSEPEGTNLCNPASDDGITTVTESLMFEAVEDLHFEGIYINNNHDSTPSITEATWEILLNDVLYDTYVYTDFISSPLPTGANDIFLALDIFLQSGDVLTWTSTFGPNTYVSAIAVSAVPVPAAGFLLLGGLGGLAVMRRRKKS